MAGGEGKWERKMSKVNETTCAYTSVSRESAATYVDGTKPFSAFRVEIEISFPLPKSAFILQMLCVIAICLFSPTLMQPQPFRAFVLVALFFNLSTQTPIGAAQHRDPCRTFNLGVWRTQIGSRIGRACTKQCFQVGSKPCCERALNFLVTKLHNIRKFAVWLGARALSNGF